MDSRIVGDFQEQNLLPSWDDFYYLPSEAPLHWAAKNGSPEEIYKLISLGASIEGIDRQGKTAAFYAAPLVFNVYHNYESKCVNYEEVISMLIHATLQLDSFGKCDPLTIQNKLSNHENLRALVTSGANTNAADISRTTLLHVTALSGDILATQLLVESGCNVNAMDEWSRRPISNAIESNNAEIVNLLIDAGADVGNLYSSIALAFHNDYRSVLKVMLRNVTHIPIDLCFKELNSRIVSSSAYEQTLTYLFQIGIDLNDRDVSGRSLLDFAVERDQYEIAVLLISKGASVNNDPEGNGFTTLHRAIKYCTTKLVKLMVFHGADLHLLRRMKVEPRPDDAKLAMLTMSFNFFKFVVCNGANFCTPDRNGKTLFHVLVCEIQLHSDYYELVKEHNYELHSKNQMNIKKARLNVKQVEKFVLFLLRNGLSINDEDHTGCTVFEHAVLFNENFTYIIVKYIVKMMEKKMFIKDSIIEFLHSIPELVVFHDECKAELLRMRSTVIADTNISLYDIVCGKTKDQLMHCSQNEQLALSLSSNIYELTFPLYYNDLEILVEEGKERRHLYENGAKAMSHFHTRHLPDLATHNIFSYLSLADIKNVVMTVYGNFNYYDRYHDNESI